MMTRNPHERFLELLEYKWVLNNRLSAKFCRNIFPNLIKKRNLTAIPLMAYYGMRSIERNLIKKKKKNRMLNILQKYSNGV